MSSTRSGREDRYRAAVSDDVMCTQLPCEGTAKYCCRHEDPQSQGRKLFVRTRHCQIAPGSSLICSRSLTFSPTGYPLSYAQARYPSNYLPGILSIGEKCLRSFLGSSLSVSEKTLAASRKTRAQSPIQRLWSKLCNSKETKPSQANADANEYNY